ncbi:hypothetical protein [Caldimonas brevitalea]|uniref:Uncharacterized protein n=1 Tax=Caldimonas brevitalea TaxID=413882 RepID=A0A0G3BD69_9BURK|nr:hypothetical protein [Caldimonas brevitalea]AKJ27319.1 hypothetical protein AAW51_0628 [Caldimonas brevitalea]
MHLDWFQPARLAARLSHGGVPNREVAYLMLASLLFSSVIFYGAFTWANPPWTWLSLYEFVVVVAITVVGMGKCYEAAGADANPRFAADFSCLTFPVWLWTTVLIWSVYWGGVFAFRSGVFAAYRFDQMGLAKNLALIGGSFGWLWTFLALVFSQVVFFAWMARVLRVAAKKVEA